jgi:hypothetical protein
MPGSSSRKLYQFIVTIETAEEPDSLFIHDALASYFDDDNQYKRYGDAGIQVTDAGIEDVEI